MKNYGYKSLKKQKKLSTEETKEFWRNPTKGNYPTDYLKGAERSAYLVKLIDEYVTHDSRILEIGCNIGRNLKFLYSDGYTDLTGIEINKEAVDLMRVNYPDMCMEACILKQPLEEVLPQMEDDLFDIVFTMAVLEHVPYSNDSIFSDISRIAKEYIITIEDEKTEWSNRHFSRNYKGVFENKGCEQVFEVNCEEVVGIRDDRFWVRVFKRGT